VYTFSLVSDVLRMTSGIGGWVRLGILLGVLAIGLVGWSVYFAVQMRKVREALGADRLFDQDTCQEALAELNITSEWRAMMYIRMGFA